jgi:hypothetical protein
MLTSIEATVEKDGVVRLKEPVRLARRCRAVVTIVDEVAVGETALLSEGALAEDWDRPEEDAAWSHLQREPWSSTSFRFRTSRGENCGRRLCAPPPAEAVIDVGGNRGGGKARTGPRMARMGTDGQGPARAASGAGMGNVNPIAAGVDKRLKVGG